MPRNNKNSAKGSSNQFELLDTEDDGTDDNTVGSTSAINATSTSNATSAINATSARGRPLKRTQPYDPESPPRKKSVPAKAKATKTAIETNDDPLLRIEAFLKRVEERAERAEKRVESLEEFVRNELFPRVANPIPAPVEHANAGPTHQHLPPSPPSPPAPGPLPGIGLDLSRVRDSEIKEGNAGTVRRRANEALKERDITCLGVNSKGNGRYRLLFQEADVDKVRQDDSLVKTHFSKGTLYGEQWYPLRIDRAYREVAIDELGCTLFSRMNGLKCTRCGGLERRL